MEKKIGDMTKYFDEKFKIQDNSFACTAKGLFASIMPNQAPGMPFITLTFYFAFFFFSYLFA